MVPAPIEPRADIGMAVKVGFGSRKTRFLAVIFSVPPKGLVKLMSARSLEKLPVV